MTSKSNSQFEFKMLIGALRYYEYSRTIASSMFPGDVVKYYWVQNKRTKKNIEFCKRVASQFADVDHINGEKDWMVWEDLAACDKEPWTNFYNFCKGYVHGFIDVKCNGDKTEKETHFMAFKNEFDGHYYDVASYLDNPYRPSYIIKDKIVEVKTLDPEQF